MSLLGLDIGTTGCKGIAFSIDGLQLASAYREYSTLHPCPGWAELDSLEVFKKVEEVLSEIAHNTKKDPVTAMSISTMGEAVTPVSENREILGNCILSSDTRGGEFILPLKEKLGQEAFYEINPNLLGPNYTLPKLKWIQTHQKKLFDKTYKFLLWGDLTLFMLGLSPVTGFSNANRTLLFDLKKEDWSEELLALAEISRDKLPNLAPSGTIAGTIDRKTSAKLGLPPNITVVVGGHDQCCNSLGAGIFEDKKAVCGIGTFECITPAFKSIPDSLTMLKTGLNIEHHVIPGLYVSFIYNQAGTLIRWFRDTFASADKKLVSAGADLYAMLSREMPESPTRLLTLPYFEMTGSPHFITDAGGVILGLKVSTTRGEILKSLMECETFYFLESILTLKQMGIDTSEFIATGGGSKSDYWLQIKADIFGLPFVRPVIKEASTLGAAILAGLGSGVFSNVTDAVGRFVKQEKYFEPDMKRHEIYMEKYENYKSLYPAVKKILRRL
ncbi:MAG: FGGY-family carbohydrate kinase [Spirochaetota bacterium]